MRGPDNHEIDAVYLWVDGNTEEFRKQYLETLATYHSLSATSTGTNRFRDNGELRYSLRSIEKNIDWIRNIYIVTNGQKPDWLMESPRLKIISHEVIFPDQQCLPTFNSAAIELNLHRIPGLSRYFLYLNDDLFIRSKVRKTDYFTKDGRQLFYFDDIPYPTADSAASEHDRALVYTRELISDRIEFEPPGQLPAHVPQLYDKTLIAELESRFHEQFVTTSRNRFRSANDFLLRVAYGSWKHSRNVFLEIERKYLASQTDAYYLLTLVPDRQSMARSMYGLYQMHSRFICINDELGDDDESEYLRTILEHFLHAMFPVASMHEKEPHRTGKNKISRTANYWNQRLSNHWGLHGVGSLSYGVHYNEWLYRIRKKIFSREIKRLLVDSDNPSLLEVGCGTGYYLRICTELGYRRISGLDISSTAIERLCREMPNVGLYCEDICNPSMKLRADTHDLVYAIDVLFHLIEDSSYQAALEQIHALLKPGGYFLLSENFLHKEEIHYENYWRSRSLVQIESMLKETGFEILRRVPMFAIMNCPVDVRRASITRLWEKLMSPVRKSELAGFGYGMLLYPIELLLLRWLKEGPSTELMICRKVH